MNSQGSTKQKNVGSRLAYASPTQWTENLKAVLNSMQKKNGMSFQNSLRRSFGMRPKQQHQKSIHRYSESDEFQIPRMACYDFNTSFF